MQGQKLNHTEDGASGDQTRRISAIQSSVNNDPVGLATAADTASEAAMGVCTLLWRASAAMRAAQTAIQDFTDENDEGDLLIDVALDCIERAHEKLQKGSNRAEATGGNPKNATAASFNARQERAQMHSKSGNETRGKAATRDNQVPADWPLVQETIGVRRNSLERWCDQLYVVANLLEIAQEAFRPDSDGPEPYAMVRAALLAVEQLDVNVCRIAGRVSISDEQANI